MKYNVIYKEKVYADRTLSVVIETDSKDNIEKLIKEKSINDILDIDEVDLSTEFVKIDSIKEMQ